ncbi:Type II secretion system F family protein [Candidatus Magnetomoraceae bacterium gMMP-13]
MPDYYYKAIDKTGKVVKGIRFAATDDELSLQLKRTGLMVLDYKITKSNKLASLFDPSLIGSVTRVELIEFSNNMGVMLKAGVPLIKGLNELREDLENKYFKKILGNVIRDTEGGMHLYEALARQPKVFPKLFVDVVEIGENTGRLDMVFFDLVKHFKRIHDMIQNVKKAMIYPCFILAALILAAIVFLAVVFPSIFTLLEEFDVPLPLVTKIIIAVSDVLQTSWVLIIIGFVGFIILFSLLRKNKITRYYIDWCELNIPYIKGLFIQIRMAFFARYLSMLLSAGVDILKSLDLSIQSINNLVLKKILSRSKQQVIEGSLLSETFRGIRFIPNMVTRMIAIGEEAGNMPEQMEYVADRYNEELERKISMALTLMEPIMIFFLAGFGLTLVMAVILPIYNMVTQVSMSAGG